MLGTCQVTERPEEKGLNLDWVKKLDNAEGSKSYFFVLTG